MVDETWSTYVFKVLRSSWGIWISITAKVRYGDPVDRSADGGGATTTLEFSGAAAGLALDHVDALRAGWTTVAADVVRRHRRAVHVTVDDVTFVETDFQVEGLAVAMCRWAENQFGLRAREIDVVFDAEENRYRFTAFAGFGGVE
jgi:hypothetical protein